MAYFRLGVLALAVFTLFGRFLLVTYPDLWPYSCTPQVNCIRDLAPLLTAIAIAISSSFAVLTYRSNQQQQQQDKSDAAYAASLCLRNPLNHVIESCGELVRILENEDERMSQLAAGSSITPDWPDEFHQEQLHFIKYDGIVSVLRREIRELGSAIPHKERVQLGQALVDCESLQDFLVGCAVDPEEKNRSEKKAVVISRINACLVACQSAAAELERIVSASKLQTDGAKS